MEKIKIVTIKNEFGYTCKVFKIALTQGFAYMKIGDHFQHGNDLGDPDKIVIIERNSFLDLWRREPFPRSRELSFGDEEIWCSDYKFHRATKGFSYGASNPVPLAYLHCYLVSTNQGKKDILIDQTQNKNWESFYVPYCAFSNGVTRTIWLLANGAECFPVITDGKSYDLLKSIAGVSNTDHLIKAMLEDRENLTR